MTRSKGVLDNLFRKPLCTIIHGGSPINLQDTDDRKQPGSEFPQEWPHDPYEAEESEMTIRTHSISKLVS